MTEVVKPVFVIDEAIELVCRRDGAFSDFGPGTEGHEIMPMVSTCCLPASFAALSLMRRKHTSGSLPDAGNVSCRRYLFAQGVTGGSNPAGKGDP